MLESQLIGLWEFPIFGCFSLVAFKILFLFLIVDILIFLLKL